MLNEPKMPRDRVIEFPDSHTAIDVYLEDWLPRLIESDGILTAALVRVRDMCLAGPPLDLDLLLAQVEVALGRAVRVKNGL
jgi:hypothetical protein